MALKTDYKNAAWGGNRKYKIINNSDGTVSFEDVTNYSVTGDVFGAEDINTTNKDVNNKVDTSKIANNLTTTSEGYVLDATQGKALNDGKISTSKIANNLTTTSSGYVLDARQGKTLNDGKIDTSKIANNLTTTSGGFVLDARQGKTLSKQVIVEQCTLYSKSFSLNAYETKELSYSIPAKTGYTGTVISAWTSGEVALAGVNQWVRNVTNSTITFTGVIGKVLYVKN